MKNQYFWVVGIIVAFVAGGLLFGKGNLASILPFAIILICPLMMLFMMGGKDHKH